MVSQVSKLYLKTIKGHLKRSGGIKSAGRSHSLGVVAVVVVIVYDTNAARHRGSQNTSENVSISRHREYSTVIGNNRVDISYQHVASAACAACRWRGCGSWRTLSRRTNSSGWRRSLW